MSNECSYCGKELTTDSCNQTCSDCTRELNNDLHNEVLLEAPTEEELCEVLSEYYGFEIMYKGLEFFPKERLSNIYCVVAMLDGCIDFADPLPLHIITLVCRFYEGVKK